MNAYPIDGSRDALWMATAAEAPVTSQLAEDLDCEIAIVGAGLTGLNAALSLAKAGHSVCVLEAQTVGFGASGRSGGQVNLGLNLGPEALIEKYGSEQGRRMIDAVVNTPKRVFQHIEEHGLRCDPVQSGWIQGAINDRTKSEQAAMAEEYGRFGCDLQIIDKNAMTDLVGTDFYCGGLLSPTAGTLQPLSYTRELARVAMESGAQIYSKSVVESVTQAGDRWQLKTARGTVSCDKVLVCCNGYTDGLVSGLQQRVVPVRSVLMATEPLSAAQRDSLLPNQMSFVDKRRLILFFRYDRDGRLCAGYHGPMRDAFCLADYAGLKTKVAKIFPQLKGCAWDYHWGGRIGMTKDTLPFFSEPLPGLMACMGYNGRGVGMGTVMGQNAARYLMGVDRDELAFPVTQPQRFLMHRFHEIGVNASITWFQLQELFDAKLQSA